MTFYAGLHFACFMITYKTNPMKNQQLLTALAECAAACNMCSTACLEEKNVTMMAGCIKLDMDCAQICATTAAFVARGSEHAKHLLKECAEICSLCATECEKHASHADHCKQCADACRRCAEACKAAIQ
jgi:hypothetical protein